MNEPQSSHDHDEADRDFALIEAVRRQVEKAEDRSTPKPQRIGRYRILGILGRGGMGLVYRAEQEKPKRDIALKVIRADATTPTNLRRFETEAQVLARLHHPGIAQVYEAGIAETDRAPTHQVRGRSEAPNAAPARTVS
jgi:serine/threonine protein kinase